MKRILAVCEVLLAEELEALLEKPSKPVPKPKWVGGGRENLTLSDSRGSGGK